MVTRGASQSRFWPGPKSRQIHVFDDIIRHDCHLVNDLCNYTLAAGKSFSKRNNNVTIMTSMQLYTHMIWSCINNKNTQCSLTVIRKECFVTGAQQIQPIKSLNVSLD